MWEYIFAFPTVLWTIPFLIVLIYWLLVILGAMDIDMVPLDTEAEFEADVGGGFLDMLSLGSVPLTVVLSTLITIGFWVTLTGAVLIGPLAGDGAVGALIWVGLFVAALVVALVLTGLSMRPMRRLFVMHTREAKANLIGHSVTITCIKVSEEFGTADCQFEGSGPPLQLNVVIASPAYDLNRDDEAVVVDYRESDNTYLVAPLALAGDKLAVPAIAHKANPPSLIAEGPQPLPESALAVPERVPSAEPSLDADGVEGESSPSPQPTRQEPT